MRYESPATSSLFACHVPGENVGVASSAPASTAKVVPAPANWSPRSPRTVMRALPVHCGLAVQLCSRSASGSGPNGSGTPRVTQRWPSKSSRFSSFQYCGRALLILSISRPSRSHLIGP